MRALYYSPSVNRFTDVKGCIIHDLHELFYVWVLDQWKKDGVSTKLIDRHGDQWSLYYLTSHEENDMFRHIDWNETFGVKMDRTLYTEGL